MRTCIVAVVLVLSFEGRSPAVAEGEGGQIGNQPGSGFHTLLSSAMRYVMNYEQQFALLVLDEQYVQELRRRPSDGTNISRSDPGGPIDRTTFRSDYLLVQLGIDGEGWMPFRDTYEVKGREVRPRDERLLKLFMSGDRSRFDRAADISHDSARHNLGKVVRTINIPLLAMMLLHPRVNERFEFTDGGEEHFGGRIVRKALYKEVTRPTLIKTTRGRDLALTGAMWLDPFTGAVVKTDMSAADPVVRGQVTVTFRRDEALDSWVPERMEEYYMTVSGLDDVHATATYTNSRRIRRTELSEQ